MENLQANLNFKLNAQDHSDASSLYSLEQTLLGRILKAATDCCSVTSIITGEKADAMLLTVTPIIPKTTNALALLISKKYVLGSVLCVASIAKAELFDMGNKGVGIFCNTHYIQSWDSFDIESYNSCAIV